MRGWLYGLVTVLLMSLTGVLAWYLGGDKPVLVDAGAYWRVSDNVLSPQEGTWVGIGTRDPQAVLHVLGSGNEVPLIAEITSISNLTAILGRSQEGVGVQGKADEGIGTEGISQMGIGVSGLSNSGIGVQGDSVSGEGVRGLSGSGAGVSGFSAQASGVEGISSSQVGVSGSSVQGVGVMATSNLGTPLVMRGYQGAALVEAVDGLLADRGLGKRFEVSREAGNVWASGGYQSPKVGWGHSLPARPGSAMEVGMVLVINADGQVEPSQLAHDTRVVGVYSPTLAFGANADQGKREMVGVAMGGVVLVQATAENGPISPGDLLTPSNALGRAMRCSAPAQCWGAMVGKALEPLESGTGMVRVLVALQ